MSFLKNNAFFLAAVLIGLAAYFWYFAPGYASGERAPDFKAVMKDGVSVQLSDFRGKVTLLHFWGSWCGPCRAENQWLPSVYAAYHTQGFEIFSVGIETSTENWQRAIEKDGLVWPHHTSDLQRFKGAIPALYRVREIPTTYLLNQEGMIVGRNLHQTELRQKIEELLGK